MATMTTMTTMTTMVGHGTGTQATVRGEVNMPAVTPDRLRVNFSLHQTTHLLAPVLLLP
jgi:hypothetical protein